MSTIEEAKNIYLQNNISLKKLSEKTGISLSRLSKLSKKEGWVQQKKEIKLPDISEIVTPEIVEKDYPVNSVGKVESQTTDRIIYLINDAFNELKQFNKHVAKLRSMSEYGIKEEMTETQLSAIDTKRLLDATRILEKAMKIRRDIIEERKNSDLETQQGVIILPHADIGD